jgi:hypothetical protein
MSTLNFTKTNNTIAISGDLTNDFDEMMKELGDENHMLFGELSMEGSNLIVGGSPISEMKMDAIKDIILNGNTAVYYQTRTVYCYLCVRKSDLKNYMFSPVDSENRTSEYMRMREGLASFVMKGFNIYEMH